MEAGGNAISLLRRPFCGLTGLVGGVPCLVKVGGDLVAFLVGGARGGVKSVLGWLPKV